MTTLREIFRDGRKAKVDGHEWNVDLSVNGKEAVLSRFVPVKSHVRSLGRFHAGGLRIISIRRPVDHRAEAI